MDKIIAVYGDMRTSQRTRVHLVEEGIAADRVEVVAATEDEQVLRDPGRAREDDLIAHFTRILDDDRDLSVVERIVQSIQQGRSVVVVHSVGGREVSQAHGILEAHQPETVFWRAVPEVAHTPLPGGPVAGAGP